MTVILNNDIARAIYLVSKDKSRAEQSVIFGKIVKFLFKKRMLSKASGILSRLNVIINKEEGRIVAKVSSAKKLDHQPKTHLEHILKKRYAAKEIFLDENLDEKLLGGLKIRVNDEVIDLSVRNKIKKLQEHLTKSA